MLTQKVLKYRHIAQMQTKDIYTAVFVEMLIEFGVADGLFYGQLVNLLFDLRPKIQNRNKIDKKLYNLGVENE